MVYHGDTAVSYTHLLKRNELEFTELFTATPHVFICDSHPLASKKSITMDDLQDYPYLTYEQGEYNSQYCAEEFVLSLIHIWTNQVQGIHRLSMSGLPVLR